jgi:hypothetical protein
MRRVRLVALAMLASCKGSISGEIYSTGQTGEATRLADQEIRLVAATPDHLDAIAKGCSEYTRRALLVADDDRRLVRLASVYSDSASDEYQRREKSREWQRLSGLNHLYQDSSMLPAPAIAPVTDSVLASLPARTATSDLNGHYEFLSVAPGIYFLVPTLEGGAMVVPVRHGRSDSRVGISEKALKDACDESAPVAMKR